MGIFFNCETVGWTQPGHWSLGLVTWALLQSLFRLDDNFKYPVCEFRLLPNHCIAIPNVHHFLKAGEQISPRFSFQWGLSFPICKMGISSQDKLKVLPDVIFLLSLAYKVVDLKELRVKS